MEITDKTELATGLQKLYSHLLGHALEQDQQKKENPSMYSEFDKVLFDNLEDLLA